MKLSSIKNGLIKLGIYLRDLIFFLPDAVKKYRLYAFVLVFLGALLIPLARGRNLTEIDKKFWGREWLTNTYAELNILLGNRAFDNSYISKGGWLIYTGELCLDNYQNTIPYSEEDLKKIQAKLDGFSDSLAMKGIKLLVVIPPDKNTVYPEYMPVEIPIIGQESRLDQLVHYQKDHGRVKVLDLRPAMLAAREQRLIYYRTDTHWNDYGALVAYQEIMRQLKPWFPELKAHALSDFKEVPATFTGDIAKYFVRSPALSEEVFHLEPVFERRASRSEYYKIIGSPPVVVTEIDNPDLPRLVVYRDSFAIALQPFLSDHYSRAVYIWESTPNLSTIESEKPDLVIFEVPEKYLDYLFNIPEGD